ncbi:2588_t:CDS:2, partial [Acaulospora colombiana]
DTRLYFFGGLAKDPDGTESCQNSVFYLDISNSFSTNNVTWIDLTTTANIPERICWQVNGGGVNSSIVYLFGGITQDNLTKKVISDTLVFAFDTKTQKWTEPSITGTPPNRRRELSVAQDNSGRMFIFGGLTDPLTGSQSTTFFNDMNILDVSNLSWLFVVTSGVDIPLPQADFTATILPDGTILYIGGKQTYSASGTNVTYKQMDQIWTYDTKEGYWKLIIAGGTVPGVRAGHSAVLASDGHIIVYGGIGDDLLTPASPDLAILDTSTSSFQWSTPKVSGAPPPVLSYHSATLIKNLMIVAFASSEIYILDITGYTWTTVFKPPTSLVDTNANIYVAQSSSLSTATSSDSTQSSSLPTETPTNGQFISINLALILGAIIGGVVSILILSTILFLLFRHWRRYRKLYGSNLPFSDPITPPPEFQTPDLRQGLGFELTPR